MLVPSPAHTETMGNELSSKKFQDTLSDQPIVPGSITRFTEDELRRLVLKLATEMPDVPFARVRTKVENFGPHVLFTLDSSKRGKYKEERSIELVKTLEVLMVQNGYLCPSMSRIKKIVNSVYEDKELAMIRQYNGWRNNHDVNMSLRLYEMTDEQASGR